MLPVVADSTLRWKAQPKKTSITVWIIGNVCKLLGKRLPFYCRSNDLPDSFYEFGTADFALVMRGYSNSKAEAEKGLRTAKMREDDERARARQYPKTAIRIAYSDGFYLQVRSAMTWCSIVGSAILSCHCEDNLLIPISVTAHLKQ